MRHKAIELAGFIGIRQHPSSRGESKQRLPVHDKPMIDDPLNSSPDQPAFERLLGDGAAWGMTIRYPLQPSPDVLAQAFLISAEFLAGPPAALVLGDNLSRARIKCRSRRPAMAPPRGPTGSHQTPKRACS
jgi:glucose-1-phosphate thymidylyltransferase